MTLGPKFLFCSISTVYQRKTNLFPKFRKIPEARHLDHTMAVSNHDLKHSGTLFRKLACDLGFAGYVFLEILSLEGD